MPDGASGVQNLLIYLPILRHGLAYGSGSTTHSQQAASSWIIQLNIFRYFRFPTKYLNSNQTGVIMWRYIRGCCLCSRNYRTSQAYCERKFLWISGKMGRSKFLWIEFREWFPPDCTILKWHQSLSTINWVRSLCGDLLCTMFSWLYKTTVYNSFLKRQIVSRLVYRDGKRMLFKMYLAEYSVAGASFWNGVNEQLMHKYISYSPPSLYEIIILYMYNNMWTKYFGTKIFANVIYSWKFENIVHENFETHGNPVYTVHALKSLRSTGVFGYGWGRTTPTATGVLRFQLRAYLV